MISMNYHKLLQQSFIRKTPSKDIYSGIKGNIYIPKNSSLKLKKVVLEVLSYIAFRSTSFDLPKVFFYNENKEVIDESESLVFTENIDFSYSLLNATIVNTNDKEWSMQEDSQKELYNKDNNECKSKYVSLDNLFNFPDWLNLEVGDKNNTTFSLLLEENISNSEFLSYINLAVKFSLESLNVIFPLCNNSKSDVSIKVKESNRETKIKIKDSVLVLEGKNIVKLSEEFLQVYPYSKYPYSLRDLKQYFEEFLRSKSPERQLIDGLLKENQDEILIDIGPYDDRLNKYKEIDSAKKTIIKSSRLKKEALNWNYEPKWEVVRLAEHIENNYKVLEQADAIEVFLSEPKEIRDKVREDIQNKFFKTKNGDVYVYRAYKQFISFLNEKMVKKLEHVKCDKIHIKFRTFIDDKDWIEEDGATPSIGSKSQAYREIPTRLLHDMYPIDEVLSDILNIDIDDISFEIVPNDSSYDYQIHVYENQQVVYFDNFNVNFSERMYLDEFPDLGRVNPNTAGIRAYKDEKLIFEKKFKTDIEMIWDYYQSKVLPETKKYLIDEKYSEEPLFKELIVSARVSEPERRLGIREEMISTLNGFHEDIYFVGLEYFREVGKDIKGTPFMEPGLILPKLQSIKGKKPTLEARLYVNEHRTFNLNSDDNSTSEEIAVSLDSINFDNNEASITYKIECSKKDEIAIKKFVAVNNEEMNILPHWCKSFSHIELLVNSSRYLLKIQKLDDRQIDTHIIDIEKEIISPEMNEIILKSYEQKNVRVYEIAKSYQGRKIHAIEIENEPGEIIAFYKKRNLKPSLVLNQRHHANEVSGTNSAYILIDKILSGEISTDIINLALIPLENSDGAAIHYDLVQANPNWKLHVARYNSVGKEIANDYFNLNSQYGECLALPRLYARLLPDVFVDNHGVPSHEWDQQFSGYVPPWFKGFWLPRAIYYGYFWYPEGEKFNNHINATHDVSKVIAKILNKDKEVFEWNCVWKERFIKYANKWLPKLFPASYVDNLIYYWVPFTASQSARHFATRYPEYTLLDITTEVSDETAQGDYLQLCAKSLVLSNIAIIDWIKSLDYTIREIPKHDDESTSFKINRVRDYIN